MTTANQAAKSMLAGLSPASSSAPRPSITQFKYYDLIMAAFVAVLLCSSFMGPSKVAEIGGIHFGAASLFFPISYIFGDILTEVYGYARARRVVWMGFAALIFGSIMAALVVALPAAPEWKHQAAFETVFGATWRVALASILGFWAGELVNSYVLAKLKIRTQGRFLWLRTISSTLIGEGIDTMIFFPIALYGILPDALLVSIMLTNYVIKCAWEILATPATYAIVSALKRVEGVDHYDRNTDFSPFVVNV